MDIVQSPSGQIIKASTGYKTFIPAALPPKLEWDDALFIVYRALIFCLGNWLEKEVDYPILIFYCVHL